tara:strand:- start:586 stop:726 length:141 start_codon:yes stop_codon:yes gene_type:complete
MKNNHMPKETKTDTMNPVIKSEIPKTSEEQTQYLGLHNRAFQVLED